MVTEPMAAGHAPDINAKRAAMIAADAAAAQQGKLVIGILAGTFLFITALVFVSSRPASVTLSPTTLAVRAAGYSAEIPRAEIDSVRLTTQLTRLGAKQNGFQWGSVYAGRFAMRPYGSVKLFVNTSRPPYVIVYAKSGVVMLNESTPAATQQLFDALGTHTAAAEAPR